MSKQILEDEDARKDLNQAQYNANEELNEVKVQEQNVGTAAAELASLNKNIVKANTYRRLNLKRNMDTNAAQDTKDDMVNQMGIDEHKRETSFVNKSPALRIAVHGMSELINTRLSTEALDICVELIEAGVQPRALSEVVLHILDIKVKNYEKEHGPILP
ncbi:uncharacterized protein LOC111598338 [Drosophila hydei]|uniref:Uncharacterized protein LOC111598338 n=1 Tax=Drosophila hydei TaxID=7224 RepID=A0A6J1LYV9_DROHY|nr:uncharacterized protein LOC111598338 [Drosophila hydei]